ncbi:transcriptional antiterminator RfaH [Bradyrhizobium sp. USDA 4503]|uniref:transcription termination/antitermination protein NusG n=1 Tax=Bradyrhizobium TaxID=374 RepID=UPI000AF705CC|nr:MULTISPECIES: transcriptional activator RfaH [Bradyrhizobium]MCP3413820.1 transcriptional activator RfaH [Bradyrhizobium brasilense]
MMATEAQLGLSWYVVQTHVNAEVKAAANLVRQGFGVYLPRYQKRRSHARRVDVVARPLFPRYLFVAIDLATQRWRAIQSTLGVSHLVCLHGRPASVENAVVGALKAREDEAGFIALSRRSPFSPGDKVRITEGAFADSLALVEGVSDHERVAVLLDLLGRKVRVLVGANLIAAA